MNHFYRAWQVSQGDWRATRSIDRLGGELPVSLKEFTRRWEPLIGNTGIQTTFHDHCESAKIRLSDARTWYDFPNTAIYSAVNYTPQALGIMVFRWITDSVWAIFYGARLFTFMFWIFAIRTSLRLLPGKGLLASAILLLPMSIYINSSLSADIMINAVSAVFLAWILHSRVKRSHMKMPELLFILLLSFLIPMLKLVYLPLLLLLLLIPQHTFSSPRRQVLFTFMAYLLGGLSALFSLTEVDHFYIPYADYAREAGWVHLAEGADKSLQTENIMRHPWESMLVVIRSLIAGFSMYSSGLIGIFGWLELALPITAIILSYLALLGIAVTDKPLPLNAWGRLVISLSIMLTAVLLVLSQYVMWTPVGSDLVLNLQGRYFIPLLLPFMLVLPGVNRENVAWWISLGVILLINAYSLWLIWERFYGL